jgi:hypothetical protein
MDVLICSIFRNSSPIIDRYWRQIHDTMANPMNAGVRWHISLYENDSTDGTKERLRGLDMSRFAEHSLITEDLNTKHYGSVVDEDRVRNLANARNRAITAKDLHQRADMILWIESDVIYGKDHIGIMLMRSMLLPRGFHVYSGIMMDQSQGTMYDTWATRRDAIEESGDLMLSHVWKPMDRFWSTFNGICFYSPIPFRKGVRFGWYNERLGKFDCDTAVVCENFRAAGYDEIWVDQSMRCSHG